jgi:hypothetical protein
LTAVFSNANGVTLGTSGYASSDISASVTSGVGVVVGPLTSTTTYTVTLPTANGIQTSGALTIIVLPVVISAVSPASPTVTAGHTVTFNASVGQAVNSTVEWSASGGLIDSGTGIWTAPSTPGTFTITAKAAADGVTSSSTMAAVVALAAIQSFTASSPTVNYGQGVTLTPVFTAPAGSTTTIGNAGSGSSQISFSVVSGVGVSTGPLSANTTFTLTVTNSAGDGVSQDVQVAVTSPFAFTGAMALARTGHTITPLADGSVLAAGGTGAADPAEIYAVGSGTFASTSAMQTARKFHTATLLTDGRVLLAGGFDGVNVLPSAEIYDPLSGTFGFTAGSMLHARQHHAAALLSDGRVLMIGGSNPNENQLASAEIFDPATGMFTDAGSLLQHAREFATATALPNGDILVAGGAGTNGTVLTSAELYTAGAFLAQSFPMNAARAHHTATLLATGQVLLSGGSGGSGALQSAEIYSGGSTGSSFSLTTGSMIVARQQHTATVLASGKVLLAGGTDGTSRIGSTELFDPVGMTFAPAGNIVTPRFDAGAALLQTGMVLIPGGTGANSASLSSAELFDPQDGLTPTIPILRLTVPDMAPSGSSQTASITLPQGALSFWWIENGTINSAANSALTFTMGSSGNTTVHVLVYMNIGLPIMNSKVVVGQ